MIFLTLGTQLPFDRLVKKVDLAAEHLDEPVFGQIGKTTYAPKNMDFSAHLDPQAFRTRFAQARVVVAHAGIGTILSAKQARKPLILMARKAKFGEHRNDHQIATVTQLGRIPGIHLLDDDTDLLSLLQQPDLAAMSDSETPDHGRLVAHLRNEISRLTQ